MIFVYKGSKIYGAELKRFLESQGENFMDYKCNDNHLYYGVADGRISSWFKEELTKKHVICKFNEDLWVD